MENGSKTENRRTAYHGRASPEAVSIHLMWQTFHIKVYIQILDLHHAF